MIESPEDAGGAPGAALIAALIEPCSVPWRLAAAVEAAKVGSCWLVQWLVCLPRPTIVCLQDQKSVKLLDWMNVGNA